MVQGVHKGEILEVQFLSGIILAVPFQLGTALAVLFRDEDLEVLYLSGVVQSVHILQNLDLVLQLNEDLVVQVHHDENFVVQYDVVPLVHNNLKEEQIVHYHLDLDL